MPDAEDDAHWPVQSEARVLDTAAIKLLWQPTKRVHLKPFIGKSAGLAEAAQALGIKKTAMSYWVGRLLAVGLIRRRGQREEQRHRVPLYRCVADRLRVSLSDAPLASYEALFDDVDERWLPLTRRALGRSLARQARHLDLVIAASSPGGVTTDLVPHGVGAPPDDFIYYRGRLWLTLAERERLRAELDALWDRYTALSDRATKPALTLLHLVTVPDAPHRR